MGSFWHLLIDLAIVLLLIAGVGQFRTPAQARWGNLTAAFALACALVVVLCRNPILGMGTTGLVLLVFLIGSAVGWRVAMRADMLQIPAMVAFQHGAGGLAVFLVSFVELTRDDAASASAVTIAAGILALAVGAATFSASLIASGKLARVLRQSTTVLPAHDRILMGLILAIVAWGTAGGFLSKGAAVVALLDTLVLSIIVGVVFSIRVGGADMPVLISFLNAASGLAAALCGVIIQDRLLIVCGATVAASGSILTHAMCKAMNRKLRNVFVGIGAPPTAPAVNGAPAAAPADCAAVSPAVEEKPAAVKPEDAFARAAQVARDAASVIVIPGYGMALAHAQFETVELAKWLEKQGKKVRFVVHPIAGRMPGHMHVLLAEADVDPDTLFEMEEVNDDFKNTDLAIVIGACDVVNPAASKVENTPISGMPVLSAEEAGHVIVCNLDDRPGYSGVNNPLYTNPNTIMLLGDAKATIKNLREALN